MEVVNCTKYLTACEKTVNGKAVTVTHYEKSSIFIYVSMEYGKIQHLEQMHIETEDLTTAPSLHETLHTHWWFRCSLQTDRFTTTYFWHACDVALHTPAVFYYTNIRIC